MNETVRDIPPIGMRTKIFFGIGSLAQGTATVAFSAYLLIFYNQVIGVSAWLVSTALLISLIFDAISNPILGQFSDNFTSRWGRRHPFMYASAIPAAILFWMMFNPPADLSEITMFFYILTISLLGRLAMNFYELPSAALTPELSDDYDERTSLMTWRYFFGYLGGLGTAFLALKVFLQPTEQYPVGQLNPDGYGAYGFAGALLILVSILVSTWGTHDRIKYIRKATAQPRRSMFAHAKEMAQTLYHGSFLAILAFGVLKYTAAGMYSAMALYFGIYVWELSSDGMAILTLDGIIAATIALIFSRWLSKRFGKKYVAIVMAIGGVTVGLMPLVLKQLGFFLPNEPELPLVITLFMFQVVYGAGMAISQIMTSSMIADVVEDSATRTGRHSSGVFFAASAFLQTCTAGVGVLAAGLLLTAAGFPDQARPGMVPAETIDTLVYIYIPTVASMWFIGVLFLNFYRIDRTVHVSNLAKLEEAAPLQPGPEPSTPDFSLGAQRRPGPAE